MICYGSDYKPEPYKAYKNRTFTKRMANTLNLVRQVKDCSLRPEDKKKLLEQMADLILKNA
jgi:hypothetical protein